MSRTQNRALHLAVIRQVRQRYPVGHLKRMELIHRSIIGIMQTRKTNYNEDHA